MGEPRREGGARTVVVVPAPRLLLADRAAVELHRVLVAWPWAAGSLHFHAPLCIPFVTLPTKQTGGGHASDLRTRGDRHPPPRRC